MQSNQKLTLKQVAIILCLSPVSISRLSKSDKKFPPLIKVGRSIFIDSHKLYKWLSDQGGQKITANDTLMTSKDIQDYYQKSHTWCWQNVKSGNLPKPFKINRSNRWMEREVVGEVA